MIYFLYLAYWPNTAPANRSLAYLRSLDRMGVPVNVIFFLPDVSFSKIEEDFTYISVEYYWDKCYIRNKYLKYISYLFYVHQFLSRLRPGDKVYLYGYDDILWKKINKTKGVDIFYETTEHPEISLGGSQLGKMDVVEHLKMCKTLAGLFVISQQLRDYYVQQGVDEHKIHIINMTVDTKRFEGLKKQVGIERYIAYCGNVSNDKDGVDALIKSFAIVCGKNPNVKLYIIGDAPSKAESNKNIQLIEDLGVKNNVVFTGRVKAEQMPQLLKNAEVLALARPDNKQAKYGFPTKLGEYLLTANPVVVTSVGDIPNFLEDGVSAYIAPPDNAVAFAEKLCSALESKEERNRVGEMGRRVALDSFNAEKETEKLIKIIQNRL